MADKKGISAIIVAVLIILITIAAVTIVWGLIIPILQQDSEFVTYDADLVIETDGGYTYFDSEQGVACVQVKRMSSDLNLSRIEVMFSYGGTTLEDKGNFSGDEIPKANEVKQKCFDLSFISSLGFRRYLAPDSIKVVPIYFDGTKEVVADVVPVVTNYGSRGGGGGGGGGGSYPGNPRELDKIGDDDSDDWIPISDCGVLNQSGETYRLIGDISGSSGICFNVTANDITIDFDGYSVTGEDGLGENGVYSDGYNGMTIRDGFIYGFNMSGGRGVYLLNNQDNNIINMTLSLNYIGIGLASSSNNIFTNVTADSNTNIGIGFISSSDNSLNEVTVDSNTNGIVLILSSGNSFSGVTACFNDVRDFTCMPPSSGNIGFGNVFGEGKVMACGDGWPSYGVDDADGDYAYCS